MFLGTLARELSACQDHFARVSERESVKRALALDAETLASHAESR